VSAAVVVCVAGLVIVAANRALRGTTPPLGPQPTTERIDVQSAALGRSMPVEWHLAGPQDGRPANLLVLLHGRYGDERSWFGGANDDGVGVAEMADRLVNGGAISPVVIASVSIDDSYGVDSSPAADGYDRGAYGTYLASELWPALERHLPVAGEGLRRFVAGYSMGGFAALHLALRDPRRFVGVGSLSTAAFIDPPADRLWVLGGDRPKHDPIALSTTADVAGLRVYLAAASGDGAFLAATRLLATNLTAHGAAVSESVINGGHDMTTWRDLAPDMLRWLLLP
jgi:enterochelin esterase-like enzyme